MNNLSLPSKELLRHGTIPVRSLMSIRICGHKIAITLKLTCMPPCDSHWNRGDIHTNDLSHDVRSHLNQDQVIASQMIDHAERHPSYQSYEDGRQACHPIATCTHCSCTGSKRVHNRAPKVHNGTPESRPESLPKPRSPY